MFHQAISPPFPRVTYSQWDPFVRPVLQSHTQDRRQTSPFMYDFRSLTHIPISVRPYRREARQSVIEPQLSVRTLIQNQTSQSVSDCESETDSNLIVRPSARIRSTVRGIRKPAKKNRWDAIFYAGNRQRPVPILNGHNKIFHHQFLPIL